MKKTAISLMVSAMVAGTAWADTADTQQGQDNRVAARDFKSIDLNNDGVISREEAARNPELAKDFDKYDANHDGRLNMGEFAHFQGQVTTNVRGINTPLENKPKGVRMPPPSNEQSPQK